MALWGATALGLFFGYRPPKRHTRYDHLSFLQKIARLDLPGFGLYTAGLTLFLVGLNLGGGLFSWHAVQTLTTLVIGIVILIAVSFPLLKQFSSLSPVVCNATRRLSGDSNDCT